MKICPLFGRCGGCQYQNVSYEEELRLKDKLLRETLSKEIDIENTEFDAVAESPEIFQYRNRLDLTLRKRNNGERQMGFMIPSSQRLLEVEECLIAREEINKFLPQLRKEANARLPENYKVANLVVRVGDGGRVAWGGIGRHSLRMKEEDYFWTIVNGKKIFYALNTFFQANLFILNKIVARLDSLVEWKKDTIFFDLYSGVGLFGMALSDKAREIVMIEEGGDSVELARYNIAYHKLEERITALVGKVEIHLPQVLENKKGKPCVALIDPPRGGLAVSTIETLGGADALESLFYLSCSPESLARDMKHLERVGWKAKKIMPFDFFPRTRHLETLVWFGRL